MPYSDADLRALVEEAGLDLSHVHWTTAAAADRLNADMDALTALLGEDESETVRRYLEQLPDGDDERQPG